MEKTDAVCSLQGFSDASQEAYAAVIYLKSVTPHGIHVRLVASKTRVAPTKAMTIPRLELLTALLLSKLMVSVSRALEPELTLDEPSCFTDSKVTLYWILGQNKEWKQFVQNRVRAVAPIANGTLPQTYLSMYSSQTHALPQTYLSMYSSQDSRSSPDPDGLKQNNTDVIPILETSPGCLSNVL